MQSRENKLTGSAQENKRVFDTLIEEVVKTKFNALIDELLAITAAAQIGADVQGLTSTDPEEIAGLLEMLENTDAGTGLMHEGVFKDDPAQFTRPWFAWANSIFSEFVEKAVHGI